jgi:hypothetical protein
MGMSFVVRSVGGDHRAGAPPHVRRAYRHAGANDVEQLEPVQVREQVEGVAAAYGHGLRIAHERGRIIRRVHAAHSDA